VADERQGLVALKERLKQPSPDDVVGAVFAFTDNALFSNDRYMLQSFFHSLREQDDFRDLLANFEFTSGRDIFPFSRTLEAALGRLQMGHRIYASNPDYSSYGMLPDQRAKMKERAEEIFQPQDVDRLRAAAEEFRSFASEWEQSAKDRKGSGRLREPAGSDEQ
jgi:hypothetical protein